MNRTDVEDTLNLALAATGLANSSLASTTPAQ